jgi:glucan phosphorylase
MRSATKIRTGLTAGEIKQAFRDNLCCGLGRLEGVATKHDLYVALALTVRDRLLERTVESLQTYGGADARLVAYLSAEFLPDLHLANITAHQAFLTREALSEIARVTVANLIAFATGQPFLPETTLNAQPQLQ